MRRHERAERRVPTPARAGELGGAEEKSVYVPIEVQLPNGARMRFTSPHGRWVSVHDALAEPFEVELLVPLDAASERVAAAAFGAVGASHPRT